MRSRMRMISKITPPPMYIVPSFRRRVEFWWYPPALSLNHAGVAELVDATGLGPVGPHGPWRFKSSRPHSDRSPASRRHDDFDRVVSSEQERARACPREATRKMSRGRRGV